MATSASGLHGVGVAQPSGVGALVETISEGAELAATGQFKPATTNGGKAVEPLEYRVVLGLYACVIRWVVTKQNGTRTGQKCSQPEPRHGVVGYNKGHQRAELTVPNVGQQGNATQRAEWRGRLSCKAG